MANLIDTAEWVDGVYQIETSDPVLGGPVEAPPGTGGLSNRQGLALAKRSQWLKGEVEETQEAIEGHVLASDPHDQYYNDERLEARLAEIVNGTLHYVGQVWQIVADATALTDPAVTGTDAGRPNGTRVLVTSYDNAPGHAMATWDAGNAGWVITPLTLSVFDLYGSTIDNHGYYWFAGDWNLLDLDNIGDASEEVSGVIRLATAAEVAAGVNASKAVTPATLAEVLPVIQTVGVLMLNIAGGSTTTLTVDNAASTIINMTGAVTAVKAVVVPAAAGVWTVRHSGSGHYPVTFRTPSGTGANVVFFPGDGMSVWCDGTNIYPCDLPERKYSLYSLPTVDIGPILVTECQEKWTWVSTQFYTGYRSLMCGSPRPGHTIVPLPFEVAAEGGVLSKTGQPRLWGYAQENELKFTSEWITGTHYFKDLGGDDFQLPDLRNMFFRMTGTDADTANATGLGESKGDTIKAHKHGISGGGMGPTNASQGVYAYPGTYYYSTETGTAETAPKHVNYPPRLHI